MPNENGNLYDTDLDLETEEIEDNVTDPIELKPEGIAEEVPATLEEVKKGYFEEVISFVKEKKHFPDTEDINKIINEHPNREKLLEYLFAEDLSVGENAIKRQQDAYQLATEYLINLTKLPKEEDVDGIISALGLVKDSGTALVVKNNLMAAYVTETVVKAE